MSHMYLQKKHDATTLTHLIKKKKIIIIIYMRQCVIQKSINIQQNRENITYLNRKKNVR